MIGEILIIICEVILCGVIVTGNSIFLRFAYKSQNVSCRILNVLLICLSILYLVFSVALVVQHVMYLFLWDWTIPSNLLGQINNQVFTVIVNARNVGFLMIALATLVNRYNKSLYLQVSLNATWAVLLVALLLIIFVTWLLEECLQLQNQLEFFQCVSENGYGMPVVIISATNTMIQLWVVVDCCYRRRKKIKDWFMSKWNRYNNIVVEFVPEEEGQEPQQVEIYVVKLQDWNQVMI